MSSPSPSSAVQRPDLGATMEEFDLRASRLGFVGLELFPVVEVGEQSANIGRIPIEELLREQSTNRASGGGYNRDDFNFEEFSYATEDHGFEAVIDDRLKRIYRRYFDAEVVATNRAVDTVLRNFEKRVIDAITSTTTFTGASLTTAVGTPWSTHATATPVSDVLGALVQVRENCGLIPNYVALDWEAFMNARECAEVVDRLKYAGLDDPKNVTTRALAQLWNVERVIVSGGQRNGANPGQAASLSSLWPKARVSVGHRATDNDVSKPAVGRTFHWSADGSSIGTVVETYRDERVRADVVRARMETDELLHYEQAAHLLTGVLA